MTISPVSSSPVAELKNKVEQRQARIAIIGLGYVGLPLALLYTEQKFRVTGFDIDQRKVSTLMQGDPTLCASCRMRFSKPARKGSKRPRTTRVWRRWMPSSFVCPRR